MSWGAAIGVASGLFGASQQRSAARAQERASEAAIEEQRRAREQARADQLPFMQYGQSQLSGLQALMGGDYSGFYNSPDYKYARDQMIYGQDHSAAARGRLNSGGYALDLAQGLNGLASQNLGNYRGALQWGANLGQNAAAGVGQMGQNAANQIGGYLQNRGNAQASGYGANAGFGYGLAGLLGQQPWASGSVFGGGSGGGGGGSSWGGTSFGNWGDY